jgi:hypothetical protein
MKKLLSLLFVLGLALSACGQLQSVTEETNSNVGTALTPTHRLTHTPGLTKTLIPSHTPRPIIPTALPKIPTFAPTFDVSTIVTVTPAPPAKCPQIDSQVNLVLNEKPDYVPDTNEVVPAILDFLNKGGDANNLIQQVNQKYGRGEVVLGVLQDLTNDGIPDVIIKYPGLLIFTCQSG